MNVYFPNLVNYVPVKPDCEDLSGSALYPVKDTFGTRVYGDQIRD